MTNDIDQQSPVYQSMINFPRQCQEAYRAVSQINAFKKTTPFANLVFSGMGGSGLAGRAIQSLFADQLKIPAILVNNYQLPAFVNQNSLVICSSYSGNTEETLIIGQQALKRGATIFSIASGGQLANWSQQNNLPLYLIKPLSNPSQMPRLGIGYSLFGQLTMLKMANLIDLTDQQVDQLISFINRLDKNLAQNWAKQAKDFIPVLIGAEHLLGALWMVKNSLNENAKNLALLFDLPDLNHYLMEGLQFPKSNQQTLKFFFFDSEFYDPQIQKRLQITQEVVAKNQIQTVYYRLTGKDRFSQVFELIQNGLFWPYHLAKLNQVDPQPIPWVDYFKAKLAE